MSKTLTKSIWADDPEDFCLRLSACLAVDKGVPSNVIEVVGDVPGTWALIGEGLALTVRPKSTPPPPLHVLPGGVNAPPPPLPHLHLWSS
jgi:hypothetical protein